MDIKHFSYFIKIKEFNYNLSAAAKDIHISQSALSKIITSFEKEEGIQLFQRANGRLTGLTPAGEMFYNACYEITKSYADMMEKIRQESDSCKGRVCVGIPPLVQTVVFGTIISDFSIHNPGIQLEIIEAGAEELRVRFLKHEMDFAMLLAPSNLSKAISREYSIHVDELSAFMSKDNPLAKRKCIRWSDLDHRQLVIFNETFTINRLLNEKFRDKKIKPYIPLKSGSWDFMVESVINSDLITILPSPIKNFVHTDDYIEIPFEDPIVWEVVFVEHTEGKLSNSQNVLKNYILEFADQNL